MGVCSTVLRSAKRAAQSWHLTGYGERSKNKARHRTAWPGTMHAKSWARKGICTYIFVLVFTDIKVL